MREDIIAVVLIVAILIAIVIVFATSRGGGTTRWSAPDDFVARSGLKGLSAVLSPLDKNAFGRPTSYALALMILAPGAASAPRIITQRYSLTHQPSDGLAVIDFESSADADGGTPGALLDSREYDCTFDDGSLMLHDDSKIYLHLLAE